MRVTVSARHCTISDEVRARAETLVGRLAQLTQFGQEATVVFGTEALSQTAEIRLRLAGGQVLVATAEAAEHRSALDQAEQRIRRQLERPAAKPSRGRRGAAEA